MTGAQLTQAKNELQRMRSDVSYVELDYRDWWSRYLASHERHFFDILNMLPEGDGRVLDVGNFPGHITVLLKTLGYNVGGVDLNPDRAGGLWERHGIEQKRSDIEAEALPYPSESWEVVILAEVLEHLRINPVGALRECHRVLRPGGSLILSVPNISPHDRLRFLFGYDYQGDIVAEFQKLETRGHMGHFRLYSESEVRRMLDHIGLDVVDVNRAGATPGGRWRWTRYLGPLRDPFRAHLYIRAVRR